MISMEILEADFCSHNLGIVLLLLDTVMKIVFEVLQFFIHLDIRIGLKTLDLGFYFVQEFTVFSRSLCVLQ